MNAFAIFIIFSIVAAVSFLIAAIETSKHLFNKGLQRSMAIAFLIILIVEFILFLYSSLAWVEKQFFLHYFYNKPFNPRYFYPEFPINKYSIKLIAASLLHVLIIVSLHKLHGKQ